MKIAIFGRLTETTDFEILREFFDFLRAENIEFCVHESYVKEIEEKNPEAVEWMLPYSFCDKDGLANCDFAYSFGGDGTLLSTMRFINETELPLLGVNFGRLGFLTSITQKELIDSTRDVMQGMYKVDSRVAMSVESNPEGLFAGENFGLNDLTIHKAKTNEMITIHTYVNGEFLNSYWGDGLIIATPTGSTAYSLSCGGPVIHPRANVFVITPIAPHSLTVRPVIIPDHYVISFEIESRAGEAMVALDTRSELVNAKTEIAIRKASFRVNLLRLNQSNYLNTLRNKFMWGEDARN